MSTPNHRLIIELLIEAGYEAVYVGGCVRDKLRGQFPNDFDIATNAKPDQISDIFHSWSVEEVGKEFGVMLIDGIEVATYRSDSYIIAGKPEVTLIGTFFQDSSRRDFTINAMAEQLDGTIIDYHGGMKDIEDKVICAVGNPYHRFIEDPSRILRGMYLAAKLSYSIESKTLQAMKEGVGLLEKTPFELVGKILMKVLKSNCLHSFMKLLAETGALKYVFPELVHTVGLPQNPKYHDSDVYTHILRVVKAVEENHPGDIVLQLSAALHDVAKGLPKIRSLNKEGQPNDLGHEETGEPIVQGILLRLGFGKAISKEVSFITRYHGKRLDENPKNGTVARQLRGMKTLFPNKTRLSEAIEKLYQFMDCDSKGFEPIFGKETIRMNVSVIEMFRKVLTDIIFYRDELPINGKHLIEWGIQGEKIGEVLEYLIQENLQDIETIIKRLVKRGDIKDVEVCHRCGNTEKVSEYMSLPSYLGWYSIPEPKNYCDTCIVLEKEICVQEVKDSFK
jgi:tRNA nucleotidyltransferase/poly(A) polymerase